MIGRLRSNSRGDWIFAALIEIILSSVSVLRHFGRRPAFRGWQDAPISTSFFAKRRIKRRGLRRTAMNKVELYRTAKSPFEKRYGTFPRNFPRNSALLSSPKTTAFPAQLGSLVI